MVIVKLLSGADLVDIDLYQFAKSQYKKVCPAKSARAKRQTLEG